MPQSKFFFSLSKQWQEKGWGVALWTKSIKHDKNYLSTIPEKSAFSKSLIVMKCFKYLICVFVKHWILNCQCLIENQEEITTWPPPPRQNGNSVNLPFYLNHCYIYISKQILEYISRLNKYMESWDAALINQLTTTILQQ